MSMETNLLYIGLLFFLGSVGLFTDEDNKTNWLISVNIGLLAVIGAEIGVML